MASRLIVHIGLQKSGTTYLQEVLASRVTELAATGVVYPIASRRRRRVDNHEWPTYDLLGSEYPWVSAQRAEAEKGTWKELERQVARAKGTVLLSAEALSTLRTPAIRMLLDRLGVDDVEIVVTARSLERTLPSLWQQHVRNGRRLGFERYLDMLEEQRALPPARVEEDREPYLWRAFALGRLVRRWAGEVGSARVRVVTSPGKPPELLWQRFCEATRIPSLVDAGTVTTPVHTGLTAPEAMVLASVNIAVERAGWPADRARRLREVILTDGFQRRSDRGPRIVIPASRRERVARWSAEDLAELRDTGVILVGDVADLEPAPGIGEVLLPTPEQIGAAGAAAILAAAHTDRTDS